MGKFAFNPPRLLKSSGKLQHSPPVKERGRSARRSQRGTAALCAAAALVITFYKAERGCDRTAAAWSSICILLRHTCSCLLVSSFSHYAFVISHTGASCTPHSSQVCSCRGVLYLRLNLINILDLNKQRNTYTCGWM